MILFAQQARGPTCIQQMWLGPTGNFPWTLAAGVLHLRRSLLHQHQLLFWPLLGGSSLQRCHQPHHKGAQQPGSDCPQLHRRLRRHSHSSHPLHQPQVSNSQVGATGGGTQSFPTSSGYGVARPPVRHSCHESLPCHKTSWQRLSSWCITGPANLQPLSGTFAPF